MSRDEHDTLRRLTDVLFHEPDIDLAVVFGSAATGQMRPDSDVDVAVLARAPLSAERKRALIATLATEVGRPIDLVDLRTAGVALTGVIIRTGKRLLCRGSRVWAGLLARNLLDSADFLPYRERILARRRQAWTR